MFLLVTGLIMLAIIIGLFWLKDRLASPLLARIAYSELIARLALGDWGATDTGRFCPALVNPVAGQQFQAGVGGGHAAILTPDPGGMR
jgi:hypothetical protein